MEEKSQKQVLEVATSPVGIFSRHYSKIPKGGDTDNMRTLTEIFQY